MSARTPFRGRTARRAVTLAALALFALVPAGAARAGERDRWVSVGLLGGSTLPDGSLANYQWDTRPHAAWGAQALAGAGRFALGARAWRSHTVQALALPAGTISPSVRSTTFELLGRARLAAFAGTQVCAGAGAGRLGIDYRPSRVVISGGPGADVVADLVPVSAWTASAGVVAERLLFHDWQLGVSLDRRVFALDTAHRSGAGVVNARETFGDWSTRLELAWRLPLTAKGTSR